MEIKDIKHLAELSRLDITEDEAMQYKQSFDGILSYVDSIQAVEVPHHDEYHTNLNVNYMREDDCAYEAGEFTDEILSEAPKTKDGFVKVKKVL